MTGDWPRALRSANVLTMRQAHHLGRDRRCRQSSCSPVAGQRPPQLASQAVIGRADGSPGIGGGQVHRQEAEQSGMVVLGSVHTRCASRARPGGRRRLPAATIAALPARRRRSRSRIGGKHRTLKTTVQATTTTTCGSPRRPAPLFAAPGVDRTGNEAYEAVKGYFANSMLTDCPAGWGVGCSVEERYSMFADGTQVVLPLDPHLRVATSGQWERSPRSGCRAEGRRRMGRLLRHGLVRKHRVLHGPGECQRCRSDPVLGTRGRPQRASQRGQDRA